MAPVASALAFVAGILAVAIPTVHYLVGMAFDLFGR